MHARGAAETVLWLCRPRDNMLRPEMDLLGRTVRGSVMVVFIIKKKGILMVVNIGSVYLKPEKISLIRYPPSDVHILAMQCICLSNRSQYFASPPPPHGWRHLPKLDKQI